MAAQIVRLQLSTPQLLSLIDKNAEIEIELTKGVQANLAEILAQRVRRKLDWDMDACVKKHVTQETGSRWQRREELKSSIKGKITKAVKAVVDEVIEAAVREQVEKYLGEMKVQDYLSSIAKDLVRPLVRAEVEKARKSLQGGMTDLATSAVEGAIRERLKV